MQRSIGALGFLAAVAIVAACGSDDNDTTVPTQTTSTKITYRATLTGAAERPSATPSVGTGTFVGTYDPATGVFTFTVNYSGLQANATLSHIHGPGTTEQAVGVILNFASGTTPFTPGTPAGSFGGSFTGTQSITTTVNGDSLRKLMDAGLTYVNVHSQQFPGGEIRGQIAKQ